MSTVGLNPVAGPSLARSFDDASAALDGQAARLAMLLGEVGQGDDVVATVRLIARLLDEEADDLRRRILALVDDVDGFFAEVWSFLGGDVLSLWNGGPGEDMPWGRWLAGALKEQAMLKFLRAGGYVIEGENALPLFNSGRFGLALRGLPRMGWLGSPAATGVLRWTGVAGGLYTGVSGTVNLVGQGNPVDAYRREGAGYVADVAGTAFGYSSAAFLLAPNPVTGAIVVGTGVVWLGAEGWDHREEIVAVWDAAAGWTMGRAGDVAGWSGDRLGDVAGWTGDRLGDAVWVARDVAVGAGQAADWALREAGALAGGVGNAAGVALDGAGNVLDEAGDMAGAVLDGAGDVAGAVVDGAGDTAGAVADGLGRAAGATIGRFLR